MKRAGKSLVIPFLFAAAAACAAGAEAPPAQHWHWNYPCEIFTGAIILGILLAGALSAIVFLLYRRKYNRITLNVHRALPVRVTVFDRDGTILFYHRERGFPSDFPENDYKHLNEMPWLDTGKILSAVQSVYDSEKPLILDYSSGGEKRTIIFSLASPKIFGKKAVIGVSHDSGDLQSARQEAADTAARFALTLQSIGDGVIVTDAGERITMINPVACELTGCGAAEALGRPLDDIFHIVSCLDGRRVPSPVREALESGKTVTPADHTDLIARDSRRRHIADSAAPIRSPDGKTAGAILVFRDVTLEYRKRDRLNLSLSLLRQAADGNAMHFFRIDPETFEPVSVFDRDLRFLPKVNGAAIPLSEWLPKEDYARFRQWAEEVAAGRQSSRSGTVRSRYSGRQEVFQLTLTPVRAGAEDETRRPEVIGILRDITVETERRKRADENLLLLTTIKESLPYPVFVKEAGDNFRYTMCNPAFSRQMGREVKETVGKTDYELMTVKTDADAIREHDRAVAASGRLMDFSEQYTGADGTVYQFHSFKQLIEPEPGRLLLLGISIDVTGEEQEKMAARRSEELLRAVLDRLPASIYVRDAANGCRFTFWNRQIAEETGIAPSGIIGRTAAEAGLPPEQIAEEAQTAEAGFVRKRRLRASGGERICDIYQAPLEIKSRRLLLGMNIDVTEQCRLSEENRRYTARLETLGRNSSILNQAFRTIALGSDFRDTAVRLLELFSHALGAERGFVFRCEGKLIVKEFEWISNNVHPLDTYNHDGSFNGVLKQLEAGRTILIEDSMQIPAELGDCVSTLLAERIKSCYWKPLFAGGRFYGFISFDFVEKAGSCDGNVPLLLDDAASAYLIARSRCEQAEQLLRQTSLQGRLFDLLTTPVAIFNADRRCLSANRSFYEIWPLGTQSLPGRLCDDEGACMLRNSSHCDPGNCLLKRTLRDRAPGEKLLDLSGRTVKINTSPLFAANGEVEYVMVCLADVSKLSGENRELATFLGQDRLINDCLKVLLLDTGFESALKTICMRLSEKYRTDLTAVMRLDETGGAIAAHAVAADRRGSGRPPELRADFAVRPDTLARLRNGRSLRCSLKTAPAGGNAGFVPELKAHLAAHRLFELIMAPVLLDGNCWGCLVSERKEEAEPFSASDERAYLEAARIVSLLLRREKQKQARANEVGMHAQIFEYADVALLMFDSGGNVVSVNRSCSVLLDGDAADFTGQPCRSICREASATLESCTSADCPLRQSLRTGRPATADRVSRERTLRISAQPIFDTEGKVQYVLESVINLTGELAKQRDLRETNLRLNEYIEQDRVIHETFRHLLLNRDPASAIGEILSALAPKMNADNCAVLQYSGDGEHPGSIIRHNWSSGSAPVATREGQRFSAEHFQAVFTELKAGRMLHGIRGKLDETVPWQKEYAAYFNLTGQHELVKQPLRIGGRFWGYFGIERATEEEFSAGQLRLFEMVSQVIQTLLEREEERRRSHSLEAEAEQILDLLDMPVIIFDGRGRILTANATACRDLGRTGTELRGDSCCALYCGGGHRFESCMVLQTIQHRKSFSKEVKFNGRLYIASTIPIIEGDRVVKVIHHLVNIGEAERTRERSAELRGGCRFPARAVRQLQDSLCEIGKELEALQIGGTSGADLPASLRKIRERADSAMKILDTPAPAEEQIPESAGLRKPLPEEPSSVIRKALIVDDVAMNVKVLEMMLRRLGFTTRSTTSGQEALRLLNEFRPGTILTDLWMPEISGMELARSIRSGNLAPEARLIAVTADVENGNHFDVSCFDAVILKPVTFEKLKKLLQIKE